MKQGRLSQTPPQAGGIRQSATEARIVRAHANALNAASRRNSAVDGNRTLDAGGTERQEAPPAEKERPALRLDPLLEAEPRRDSLGRRLPPRPEALLTPETVLKVLESTENVRQISIKCKVSRRLVTKIQYGEVCSEMFPEIPRRRRKSYCFQCLHYAGTVGKAKNGRDLHRCGLSIPEIEAPSGVLFARECSCFILRSALDPTTEFARPGEEPDGAQEGDGTGD